MTVDTPMEDIIPKVESNIKAFYIFDSNTGNTFLSAIYSKRLQTDPLLATAFLTAMYKFARDANLSDLRVINLSELTLFFIEKEQLIFAALTSTYVAPVDMISKLKLIASLFLSNYRRVLKKGRIIVDTQKFADFYPVVGEILKGESRTLDPRIKEAIVEVMEKILEEEQGIVSGVAIIGYTGEAIVDFMNREILEAIINFNTICFDKKIYNVDFIIMRSSEYNVMERDLGEGLMLTIATESSIQPVEVIKLMSKIYNRVKALLPN
ncbi:MAG: hypothetical protein ACXAEU_10905 [Candidatus Hodarchaeales archaeon]|jgi:hypothetical protein